MIIPLTLVAWSLFADLSPSKLDTAAHNHDATYDAGAEAMTEAIAFSLIQTQSRVKLPGVGRFFLEGAFLVFDVNDKALQSFTDNNQCPSSFQTLILKAGVGLPFGFSIAAGLSQGVSEHTVSGLNASVSYQVFDFSTWITGDLVPAMTIDLSAMRSAIGPALYSFTGQMNLGAYQRTPNSQLTQFAYALRLNSSTLAATASSVVKTFVRNGVIAQLPIYSDLFLRTEIYFPTITGVATLGYQF